MNNLLWVAIVGFVLTVWGLSSAWPAPQFPTSYK